MREVVTPEEDQAMNLVIHDPETVQQLRQARAALFLTDSAGAILGHFVPGDPIGSEPRLSEEEWRRLEQEPSRPLAEIFADLEERASASECPDYGPGEIETNCSTVREPGAHEPMMIDVTLANNRDVQNAAVGAIPSEQVRQLTLQAVVDTTAAHMVLPTAVAEQLGLPKVTRAKVDCGQGRFVIRDMVELQAELLGRQGTCRAILDPDRMTPVIGFILLGELDLVADYANQRVYPRDPAGMTTEVE